MTEQDKAKDLQDLARGLDELTEEGGPLVRLICEVRKSNALALRNVRLQLLALFSLFLCLVCLLFLCFLFYKGVDELTRTQNDIVDLASDLRAVANSVGEVKDEVQEAPKIVADDRGKLKIVANVRLDDDFITSAKRQLRSSNKRFGKSSKHLQGAQERLQVAMDDLEAEMPAEASAPKKVEIPLDMGEVTEK